jgi:hypothetical protein
MPAAMKKKADQNLYTAMVGRCAFLPKTTIKTVERIPDETRKPRKTRINQIQ